ncbi:putative flbA protein [Gluconacetobacter diazotrophicus PA1 5]|uniref:Putative flbA protein n=2 Tax=Gluconacetobacter diazotrophicus TaxID=33996 RepID=A9HH41_GLUDA|nr:putative flbA protein [Gluconacetobacter diazotrophicus PA1 5]
MQQIETVSSCEGDATQSLDADLSKDTVLQSPTAENVTTMVSDLFLKGEVLDAVRLALEVVARHPDNVILTLVAATLLARHTALYDVVATLARRALKLEPDSVGAQTILADALVAGGDVAGGCALFADMMARYPGERIGLCEHISFSLVDAGYPFEALGILTAWLQEGEPSFSLLNNMACILDRMGRPAEAVSWYKRALAMDPGNATAAFGYSLSLLKAGNFREGWARYAERVPLTNSVTWWFMSLPRLRHGDDVSGKKIILYQEQGLGDTLHFIRFVPYLQAKGADVTIVVPKALLRLLTQSFPGASVRLIEEFGREVEDGYSYAAPIPDLPFIGGVMSESDIPANIPYFRADAGDIAKFAAELPSRRPRIGLVWAGERRGRPELAAADRRRSTTLAMLGEALTPVDATLVNIQFGVPHAEIAAWHGQPVFDPMGGVRDMADTAAIMESLDLFISVDTSPLHLAGGLGRPTWLISRWDACWRWGAEGDTSAWYPTMRVFRAQERTFGPVLREVGEALREWVKDWQPGKGA